MSKKLKPEPKATVQPRIILDADVLAAINDFYASYLDDKHIGLECFSHPSLERHVCNVQALREGSNPCEYCSNIVGRECPVTCNIHWFCLAAYAVRLGIGVTSRTDGLKSIINNLDKLSYAELYDLVMARHKVVADHLEVVPTSAEPKDLAQLDLSLGSPKPVTQSAKKLKEVKHDDSGEDLLTIFAAAKLYECTHATMYSLVNRGAIAKVEYAGAVFVRKADVLKLKESKRV